MKIGVLTLRPSNNYGGILQAYALQKFLLDEGYDAELIDIEVSGGRAGKLARIVDRMTFGLRPVCLMSGVVTTKRRMHQVLDELSEEPRRFIADNIRQSSRSFKQGDFSGVKDLGYDVLVVGSDQVWRRCYVQRIQDFFFGFDTGFGVKKVAYAASFGTSEWLMDDAETRDCARLLSEFDAVSVREESAVGLCRQRLGRDASLVVDPTLLHCKEVYERFCGEMDPEPGLCAYVLDESKEVDAAIEELGSEHAVKVVRPMVRPAGMVIGEKGRRECKLRSVESWLEAFRNARFVVTDSFHGTVFAVLFNKPFITYVNRQRGASRFESLLGRLGLRERMVYRAEDLANVEVGGDAIDWEAVNAVVDEWRSSSKRFLLDALRGGFVRED